MPRVELAACHFFGKLPPACERWLRGLLTTCGTALFILSLLATPPALADVVGYRFIMPTLTAQPGEHLRITVKGEHERSAQGFVFAARYPSSDLTIERVHIEDTILEAIEVDYFEARVAPEDGTLIVGVLVDSSPPFDGELIPNIGFALAFFHIEAQVSEAAGGDLRIQLENGLSFPPVENLYSVDNQSADLSELGEAVVHVPIAPGRGANFLRGDANMDLVVDISDPISVLAYAFNGDREPPCLLAADANDDERVDISDPIYTLDFLFTGGNPPPSPNATPGPDMTLGYLSCVHSL